MARRETKKRKGVVQGTRGFFTRNKIFFEIFQYVGVGAVSLWLGFRADAIATAQLSVALDQHQVAREQLLVAQNEEELDRAGKPPSIAVSIDRVDPKDNNSPNFLRVWNRGGVVHDPDVRAIAFANVSINRLAPGGHRYIIASHASIPFLDYFDSMDIGIDDTKGLLFQNPLKDPDIIDDEQPSRFSAIMKKGDEAIVNVTCYVLVTFVNDSGEYTSEYFSFPWQHFGTAMPIDQREGTLLFKQFKSARDSHNGLKRGTVGPAKIREIWALYGSPGEWPRGR